jgi:stage V sporulation protein AD
MRVTVGRVKDKGITDANNMGAAMAPAAYETLKAHFEDTGLTPADYDLIATGDLGKLGHEIVTDLFDRDGVKLPNYTDCGLILFDRDAQDVHAGASGCGCSASVLCGHLLPGLLAGRWKKILFCPTGALHSPTATMQGESIPGVCHALALEA